MTDLAEAANKIKLVNQLRDAADNLVDSIDFDNFDIDISILKEFEWALEQPSADTFRLTVTKAKTDAAERLLVAISNSKIETLLKNKVDEFLKSNVGNSKRARFEVGEFTVGKNTLYFYILRGNLASAVKVFWQLIAKLGITDIEEVSKKDFLESLTECRLAASELRTELVNLTTTIKYCNSI